MGIFHTLHVQQINGKMVDVGGYSKGGSLPHWFFAFSPTEYQNNLEEMSTVNDIEKLFVGYRTTVQKAVKRLETYAEKLTTAFKTSILKREAAKDLEDLYYQMSSLRLTLKKEYEPNASLILNQSDGAFYALEFDKENQSLVSGLKSYWYDNEASQNAQKIDDLVASTMTLEEKASEFLSSLPDDSIRNFYVHTNLSVAQHEQGWGPSLGTELFKGRETNPYTSNPVQFFTQLVQEINDVPNLADYERYQVYKTVHAICERTWLEINASV